MAIWQWGLLALAAVWALQSLGVWLQMRHYSDVFKGITNQFKDGYVGAGHTRGRFGKGTIALVVVTPDLMVQRLMTMTGRSVFAKFERHQQFEGMPLSDLQANPAVLGAAETGVTNAVAKAVEQVEKVRQDAKGPGLAGLKAQGA